MRIKKDTLSPLINPKSSQNCLATTTTHNANGSIAPFKIRCLPPLADVHGSHRRRPPLTRQRPKPRPRHRNPLRQVPRQRQPRLLRRRPRRWQPRDKPTCLRRSRRV